MVPVGSTVVMARSGRRGPGQHAMLGCAALLVAALSAPSAFLTLAGRSVPVPQVLGSRDEAAVARRVSPYYSNADRERLLKRRQELRTYNRENPEPKQDTELNFDKLPSIEDVFRRKYTGNAETDPIGGRMKYTYYVMYKFPLDPSVKAIDDLIKDFIAFLKLRMSCKDIKGVPQKKVQLEYPMKEYGEAPRMSQGTGKARKREYSQAVQVRYDFKAPPMANEYITARIHRDNNILRFMRLGHFRSWRQPGEDNELLL